MKNVKYNSRLAILDYMYYCVVGSVNDSTTYINFSYKAVV